ncbi:olfactory receptor 4D6-like [Stegastes partitus]|uniref:Olfactory receptor n=1 Tax=Stegastes partitus TaxID=144197 RepID=A0A9Y4TXZ8_9TELE|nr:PREDICTED: olfactory receptor 4D6-like [Stegastes partitus]
MDDNFNATHITFDGYVQVQKYRYLYFLMMFTLYVLIICSNSTIVYLIWIHRNLHEPMYIFIAALSTNSILFSSVIYPKILVDVLSERQIIPYSACLFQWFLCYSLGLSDFLILAAMAYDRYVSICKPLQHPLIMKKSTITALLLSAWLVPACHMLITVALSADRKLCSSIMKGMYCSNSIYKLHCVSSRLLSVFGVITLVNSVIFPVLFILFTYTRIIKISYKSSGDVRKKAAETCVPHLLILISCTTLAVYETTTVRVKSDVSKTTRLNLQAALYHPLLNPIIYGLKMKEIFKHLKAMMCPVKPN